MFFNKKGSKSAAMLTKFIAVFMSAVVFSLLTGAVIDLQAKQVTLVMVDAFADSEKTQELTTRQNTVSEFLEENEIKLGEFDKLSMLPEDELYSGARLIIRKGRNFILNIDGNIEIITTTKKTIREAFEEAGVSVSGIDRVEPSLDSEVTEDMQVSVFRVAHQEITEDKEIPFTSKEVSDSSLEKGKTRIKVKGVNGLKRTTYSVTTENGVETKREVISEVTVKEPTAQVVAVGTKAKASSSGKKTVTTAAGKSLSYSKKLTVTATAYTAAAGKKTASGRVAEYGVIAVDPKVIPLGTKLYVESTDDGKSWQYGYCVAGDTGGAIKGNKIDLYYNSKSQCLQFGRRSAIVYVLN
ncbi:MAG: G5 domain-containing protein [Clostridia bacterium]|nr:G5 domain-containing protein [Clostridia bacterium]